MFEKLFFNMRDLSDNNNIQSILVKGDLIDTVGTYRECKSRSNGKSLKIDCQGNYIVPGLIDSHSHLIELGEAESGTDLSSETVTALLVKFHKAAKANDSGLPLIIMGLSDDQFSEMANRRILPVVGGMIAFHKSGHCAIADDAAARILNKDARGNSHIIIEEPYEDKSVLMMLQNRKHNEDFLEKCLNTGLESYRSYGITSLQDNTWDPEVYRYYSMNVKGMDISCWTRGKNTFDPLLNSNNISIGPAKFFIDGAFYNRMAWLNEPYEGEEDWYGQGMEAGEIIKSIEPLIASRRQCAFHAAGDRAISEVCTALEYLLEEYPWIPEMRIRLEHAQLIRESDFERIRNLGLIISAQPAASSDYSRDLRLLGDKRAEESYPHFKILREEIPLAFGSDYPYENTFDPFAGIDFACNRQTGHSMTRKEALSAYTKGSAYAGFEEKRKGLIAPGFQADFFITDQNILDNDFKGRSSIRSVFSKGDSIYSSETSSDYLIA